VSFKQGTKVYSGTPAAQIIPNILVVQIPADTFVSGVTPIDVTAVFVDSVSNESSFTGQILLDTVAPAAVSGITTLVDSAGHVTISWTNPTAGTYTKLRLVRVGDFSVVLDSSATSYTDLTTEQGKTYQYVVVVGDDAGNETNTPQVTVSVPAAVVAAAVSDTNDYVAPETNTEEVKAADEVTADDSDTEDENKGFPTWGIILLLILAAVGGYLIWTQGPETAVAPAPETKKNTKTKK